MEVLNWSQLNKEQQENVLARPELDYSGLQSGVADIIAAVRKQGDQAVRQFTREFDRVEIDRLAVDPGEIKAAASKCDAGLLSDMDSAISRIKAFHEAGIPQNSSVETAVGLVCESRYLPISPVGLYVPGGTAPLVSTVMMLGVPAMLAGCENTILCSPPSEQGSIHPALLAAADRCGITRVFQVGGAQAIAAMAFGTETIPKCTKLFGPGNTWVTEAKQQVSLSPQGAARDMPAGPSEVMVIADGSADSLAVCWDLLSQAEHGTDSQAILVSDCQEILDFARDKIEDMAAQLPRAEVLSESLKSLRLIRVVDIPEAIGISNRYAPEHLILNCLDADNYANEVKNAGSVFIGAWTPESLGDYCSGTNHVLPTYGYARAYSGLSVSDFMRRMTLQSAKPEGLKEAGPVASRLAALEGLDAHRMAVDYRIKSLEAS